MISPNLYSSLARYYDVMHVEREYEQEATFIQKLFLRFYGCSRARALDLFCGTGGHSLPMAMLGFDVLGLDISEDMLMLAKRKTAACELNMRFELGDCRSLSFRSEFDLVVCLGQSLQYLLSYEEIQAAFAGIRRALKPGGLCIFDIIDGWSMLKPFESRRFDVTEDGTSVLRFARTELDRARRLAICRASWVITTADSDLGVDETVEEYRIFFVDELMFLLSISGFEALGVFADGVADDVVAGDCVAVTIVARALPVTSEDPVPEQQSRW
jgi:SAM-dependent methyltransferase